MKNKIPSKKIDIKMTKEEKRKIFFINLLTIGSVFIIILAFYFSYKSDMLNAKEYTLYDYLGIGLFLLGGIFGVIIYALMNSIENIKEKMDNAKKFK